MKSISLFAVSFASFSLLGMLTCPSAGATTISPQTLSEAEAYPAEQLQNYRQSGYKLVDPAGDLALLRRSQLVPSHIMNNLTHKKVMSSYTSRDEEYEIVTPEELPKGKIPGASDSFCDYLQRNPSLASLFAPVDKGPSADSEVQMQKLIAAINNMGTPIQGKKSPVRRNGFNKMFAEIIKEEEANGIEPSYGTPHQWSKEFLDKYGGSSTMLMSSKLLMALADGDTIRYMRTEQEANLYNWMVAKPNSSLTIDQVFRKSYELNSGDVYKTLMTIENILAHQWHNSHRESLPLTNRLKPITSGHEYAEDRFGTWYHFFGIMIYGYVEGGLKAELIGRTEALGSFILSPSVNKAQKKGLNLAGGWIGDDLAKLIRTKSYENFHVDPANLVEASYLDQTEDFRDRIQVALSPEIKASLERDEDRGTVTIRDTERSLRDCKVEVMPDATGWGFDASDKTVTEHVDIGSQYNYVPVFNRDLRAVRGFISCPDMPETLVFEAK